jgi:Pvc16 N-terminal domain
MSNHLAIATVTATLQRILQQAVQSSVEGSRVTTTRPESNSGVPETGINLYLYHIKRNPAWNNADTPGRQRRAEMVKRHQIAIDLYYVLTFYGNDGELEPQRLLGTTLQIFEDQNIITPKQIQEAVSDPSFSFLSDSDLAEQLELICTEFVPISTDELSKVWSVFFQTPYALSVIYKVTVLLIEGEEPGQRALPVRDRRVGVMPFAQQPTIESVMAQSGRYDPILSGSILHLRGQGLSASTVRVRVGSIEFTPTQVSATEVIFPLSLIPSEQLRAGVQGVQIVHPAAALLSQNRALSRSVEPRVFRGTESNVAPFVLRPTIVLIEVEDAQGREDDPRSAMVRVTLDVRVGKNQRAMLLLNERSVIDPANYVFLGESRTDDRDELRFAVSELKAGEYLVRVQIDGAESTLQVEMDVNSPRFEQYIAPMLTLL